MNELLHLKESQETVYMDLQARSRIIKKWFDIQKASSKSFREG